MNPADLSALTSLERLLGLAATAESGETLALATVVDVRGSSYRRPGARLLVTADGRSAGLISGGCLEDDVRSRAADVIATGNCRLVTYDSTAPEDLVFGLGLGCSGVVKIFIEPVAVGEKGGLLAFLEACVKARRPARMAVVFESDGLPVGSRWMQWPDGTCAGTGGDDETVAALERVGGTTDRRTSVRDIILPDGRWGRALVEIVAPPPELVVFGAGDDAMPLAQGAKALGWHVTVVDHRPACATATRFPWADAIHCLRPDAVAERPHLVPADALAMVMTHHFEHDRGLLSFLIDRPLRYLGILGPASRTQRLLDGCGKGTTPVLHGPAGLDLGAETPEEIALSILAEMQAALTRRPATPLRSRHGPIHATIAA